jgi:glycine betaine/proline transport system ATP-binding protein
MIEIRGLTKIFGVDTEAALSQMDGGVSKEVILRETGCTVAVRDASFSVEKGDTFVVMGRSGSGKSTLLRCLNRLVTPTRGVVELEGEDLTATSAERLREVCRTRLSMVFQQFGLFPHRTVRGNVAFGLEVSGVEASERRTRVDEALDQVGLRDYAEKRPDELSGGMQQRVGLARALATDPDILLMDEPFSALDPLIRTELQDEVMRLQAEDRRTIVFITHDVDEAFRIGDRLAIMDGGEIVQTGAPVEILSSPATPYVRDFVSGVDRMQALTAGDIATVWSEAAAGNGVAADPSAWPSLDAETRLGDAVARVLRDGQHRVVQNDEAEAASLRVITPDRIAEIL